MKIANNFFKFNLKGAGIILLVTLIIYVQFFYIIPFFRFYGFGAANHSKLPIGPFLKPLSSHVGMWQDSSFYIYAKPNKLQSKILYYFCSRNKKYKVFSNNEKMYFQPTGIMGINVKRIAYTTGDVGCYRKSYDCRDSSGVCHSELNVTKGEFSMLRLGK